jgi:hypothetical protein
LSQSTLIKATEIWKSLYGLTEYNIKTNPHGHYVIDKAPPHHFVKFEKYKDYHNIITFWNGATIFVGSLDNYKAHDGKEFCWAHLDETKDTREEAVTTVILARLSQRGLFYDAVGTLVWEDDFGKATEYGYTAFNPCWIHTSPAIGTVDWLLKLFDLSEYEAEIREAITRKQKIGENKYRYGFFHRETEHKSITIFPTHHNKPNLPPNYIEQRESVLTENEQLKFIYGYPFSKTGGEYYPYFERVKHVEEVEYNPELPVHVTFDFNVLPYMTLICAQVEYYPAYFDKNGQQYEFWREGLKEGEVMQIRFFREYCMATPYNTTEEVCNAFSMDFQQYSPEVYYYGDASGRRRLEGLALNNYSIVERVLHRFIHNGSDRVNRQNVEVLKRRDLLNRILAGKYPYVELVFDPSLKETIRDFEFLKQDANGKMKEKAKDPSSGAVYEKIGHTSDAVEYLVTYLCKHLLSEL